MVIVAFAASASTIDADQTVTFTTTVTGTAVGCSGVPAAYVQAIEGLLLLVLIFAAVVAVFLVRLYRKTRF